MAIHFRPPIIPLYMGSWYNDIQVFLAGTIEMGKSRNWQEDAFQKIDIVCPESNVLVYNPRRLDFDAEQVQTIENPYMFSQIDWEMRLLEASNIILFNFEPNTVSPISIGELYMYAKDKTKQVIVHCPTGYLRKANIDYTCQRYGVHQVDSYIELIDVAVYKIKSWQKQRKSNLSSM